MRGQSRYRGLPNLFALVKGKIKEKVGQLTNDPGLEGEGIGEKIAGKVQTKIGQVEKAIERP